MFHRTLPASVSLLSLLPRPKPYSISPSKPSCDPSGGLETLTMTSTLEERDVGIACYVSSSLPGFHGVLKQRYSDFIVNEVDLDGKIVRLTSFDLPPECPVDRAEENSPSIGKGYTEEIKSFQSLSGDTDAELLRGLIEKIASGTENGIGPIILSPDPDKSHRAEIHNFFKKNFKFLVTDTVEESEGNSKRIRVRFCLNEGGGKGRRGKKRKDTGDSGCKDDRPFDSRGSDNWPEHIGKFLRFHLYKENKDTQEAFGVIGKMLGVQQRAFGFAGTKDKRSISTQRVTIFKQHARRLASLNSRLIGIKIGDFCYAKEGLVLGQLLGNRFTITLRSVVADSENTIRIGADGLGKNGFINYYGLQRFGSGSVPTHLIGSALLRGEWKSAVSLILDPRDGEREFIKEARENYKESGDIDLALRQFPRNLVAERAILQCLKKCPGNYLQALKAVPRTLRMMYVHSYQSYLWNHAASVRVQNHGISEVVLGDLVYCKHGSAGDLSDKNSIEPEDNSDDPCTDTGLSEMSVAALPEEKVNSVKVVNSGDLLTGGYTIEDVVLPLPGSRALYPANDVAEVFHNIAKKDGISLTESVHGIKDFSITTMTGGYRRLFQRPIDFSWELLTYTDGNLPLVETDLDTMSKTKPADVIEGHANGKSCSLVEHIESEQIDSDGKVMAEDACIGGLSAVEPVCASDAESPKVALKLEFTLPASCYATMAIRELLKTSTSVAYQKTLNG